MKIKPTREDFKIWLMCVPTSGDLVFLEKRHVRLPSRKVDASSFIKLKKDNIWTLNSRSWYRYALGRSPYYAWLAPGEIEKLPKDILQEIARTQVALNVPTLIKANKLSKGVREKSLHAGSYAWITAQSWEKFSQNEKISVIEAWFAQNIAREETIAISQMPAQVRQRMKDYKFEKIVNGFRNESGGNCFAAAGAFAMNDMSLLKKWVFWPELKNILEKSGFRNIRSGNVPQYGDILVFKANKKPVHAAIYLGENIFFEKAGQDFYAPYRTVYFEDWEKEWPKTTLAIFRKREV